MDPGPFGFPEINIHVSEGDPRERWPGLDLDRPIEGARPHSGMATDGGAAWVRAAQLLKGNPYIDVPREPSFIADVDVSHPIGGLSVLINGSPPDQQPASGPQPADPLTLKERDLFRADDRGRWTALLDPTPEVLVFRTLPVANEGGTVVSVACFGDATAPGASGHTAVLAIPAVRRALVLPAVT